MTGKAKNGPKTAPKPAPVRPVSVGKSPDLSLPDAIEASAQAAAWLGPSDQAAVDLAVYLARMLQAAGTDPDTVRTVAPMASALARLLNDLGLTSRGRPDGTDTGEGVTWLDELRERRSAATPRGRGAAADRNA